jgi:hypothetical protein
MHTYVTQADCLSVASPAERKRRGWIIDTFLYRALAQRFAERNGLVLGEYLGEQKGRGLCWDASPAPIIELPTYEEEPQNEPD